MKVIERQPDAVRPVYWEGLILSVLGHAAKLTGWVARGGFGQRPGGFSTGFDDVVLRRVATLEFPGTNAAPPIPGLSLVVAQAGTGGRLIWR